MILKGKIDLTGVAYLCPEPRLLTDGGKVIGLCKVERDGTVMMEVPDSYFPLLAQRVEIPIGNLLENSAEEFSGLANFIKENQSDKKIDPHGAPILTEEEVRRIFRLNKFGIIKCAVKPLALAMGI